MEYESDTRFCQILIEQKAIPLERLHGCAEIQRSEKATGVSPRSIEEILVSESILTWEQIEEYHRALTLRFLPPQRQLGDYQILEQIARGGMGIVYKARDRRSGRVVALKILSNKRACETQRFQREANVACALHHPNIVRGFLVGQDRGLFFFVMEYVPGETLGQLIERRGRLGEADTVVLGIHIARALHHAAGYGIIHRDVKPANIIVEPGGRAKLCDLGLARPQKVVSTVTTSGVTLGTPKYMAPEQARGDADVDSRADIYALGITLYHAFVGQPPFQGASGYVVISKHLYEDVPAIREARPSISDGLNRIVLRMTRRDPAERYPTPRFLLRELAGIARRRGYPDRLSRKESSSASPSPS